MEMLVFSTPRWFSGNDRSTRWNPAVVGHDSVIAPPTILTRLARRRVFGKSPANAYLRLNQRVWEALPESVKRLRVVRFYGMFVHALAMAQRSRAQARSTFFLRNRPALDLLRRVIDRMPQDETIRIAVLGCSTGAEVYSVAWAVRSARPDLTIVLNAVDISAEAVDIAKSGTYSLAVSNVSGTPMLERMTPAEMDGFFERQGDVMSVKPSLRSGIQWHVGDVTAASTLDRLGPQDVVIASNFLCHMEPCDAETCLRGIARLVRPLGFLFVTGIDLDVRTKVARDLAWSPVQELLEEIHDGDPCARGQWPYHYAGLEPLDKTRDDWRLRYASVFELPEPRVGAARRPELLFVR
jgi:SAM-dependent methyltransferase